MISDARALQDLKDNPVLMEILYNMENECYTQFKSCPAEELADLQKRLNLIAELRVNIDNEIAKYREAG